MRRKIVEQSESTETCKDLSSYLFSVCMRRKIVEQSESEQSSAEKKEEEREEKAEEEREGESNNTQFDKIEKNSWVVVE
ncbi:hypothetical protein QE152_g8111 [Popillia japonica]|uniref:Uncharacterized protein n=1 Tax=Popillia japonica TaxID=7064 RepID=A0AAW1M5M7_POPJA